MNEKEEPIPNVIIEFQLAHENNMYDGTSAVYNRATDKNGKLYNTMPFRNANRMQRSTSVIIANQ